MKRAYGSEPVLLDASPITSAPTTLRSRGPIWKRRSLLVLCCVAVLVIIVGVLAWRSNAANDLIPAAVRQTADFRLYQPGRLPAGFSLDKGSFRTASQVVTFSISYNDNRKIIISEQPKPSGFDFDLFYEQFTDKKSIAAPVGKAVMGRYEDADLASVIADKTWILVRAPAGIESVQLEQLLLGFK
jgi:hypothetical protein